MSEQDCSELYKRKSGEADPQTEASGAVQFRLVQDSCFGNGRNGKKNIGPVASNCTTEEK